MKAKTIVGILLLLCSAGLIYGSLYITKELQEGKLKISDAQEKVDQGNSLFSLSPQTKALGEGIITKPAQKKIDAANRTVADYEVLAQRLLIAGVIAGVLGITLFFIRKKRK